MTDVQHPGFADPVHDSQATFRALLDAMAQPGKIHTVTAPAAMPAPLHRATAAVLLALVDAETPLWLDEEALPAYDWLAFHCGALLSSTPMASFAVALSVPNFVDFNVGSDEEPESSATLILQLPLLGDGATYQLTGPGLDAPAYLAMSGLDDRFARAWQANHGHFPRGLDVIFCAGDRLAALPRTTWLEVV